MLHGLDHNILLSKRLAGTLKLCVRVWRTKDAVFLNELFCENANGYRDFNVYLQNIPCNRTLDNNTMLKLGILTTGCARAFSKLFVKKLERLNVSVIGFLFEDESVPVGQDAFIWKQARIG